MYVFFSNMIERVTKRRVQEKVFKKDERHVLLCCLRDTVRKRFSLSLSKTLQALRKDNAKNWSKGEPIVCVAVPKSECRLLKKKNAEMVFLAGDSAAIVTTKIVREPMRGDRQCIVSMLKAAA